MKKSSFVLLALFAVLVCLFAGNICLRMYKIGNGSPWCGFAVDSQSRLYIRTSRRIYVLDPEGSLLRTISKDIITTGSSPLFPSASEFMILNDVMILDSPPKYTSLEGIILTENELSLSARETMRHRYYADHCFKTTYETADGTVYVWQRWSPFQYITATKDGQTRVVYSMRGTDLLYVINACVMIAYIVFLIVLFVKNSYIRKAAHDLVQSLRP